MEKIQQKEFFYEFNIHKETQYGRYGITFLNTNSQHTKDVTFAYKVVKKKSDTGTTPSDAAPSSEEAALYDVLEQSNTDMGHFMTENKF